MFSGVRMQADSLMPKGTYAVIGPQGMPRAIGSIGAVMPAYQPGDVLVMSEDDYNAIAAEFATDVTPKPALPHEPDHG